MYQPTDKFVAGIKPKKKKNKNSAVEENAACRVHADQNGFDGDNCHGMNSENGALESEENLMRLIGRIQSQIPENDTLHYKSRLNKLDWNKIKFDNYNAEECRSEWEKLSSAIRKFRTLQEIVEDAKVSALTYAERKNTPAKPLSTYMLYYMDTKSKIQQKYPGISGKDIAKHVGKRFKKLSPGKLEIYKERAKNLRDKYDAEMRILSMNDSVGFAFGLTNDLHSEETHPVIVGSGCKPRDILYFWIVNNDWLVMRKNYSQKTDLILPVSYEILWPIFELYGNTKIRMWSCLKVQEGSESSYRPDIVPISERTIQFSHRTANASSSHVNTSDVQNRTSILQKRRTSSTDASEKSVPDESAVKKVAFSNNNQKPTETEEKCVICFDAPIKAVLYKCGHACLCMQCAKGLLRSNGTGNCPICRMKILDIIPFFKA